MNNFLEEMKQLWSETLGDARVRIALLDGPADQSHPSLRHAALIRPDSSFPTISVGSIASRHGTHTASIIFGQHDSPVQGIAPECRGILIPTFQDSIYSKEIPACSQTDLAFAINTAIKAGVHIINISAGEFAPISSTNSLLEEAIHNCENSKVLVFAAAGNQGCHFFQIPSAFPSVIAVGAMNKKGEPLRCNNWSSFYEKNVILAPGEAIHGALPGGRTSLGSGTSYATAIASGVAALLLSLQLKYTNTLDVNFVREILFHPDLKEGIKDNASQFQGTRLNISTIYHLARQKLRTVPQKHIRLSHVKAQIYEKLPASTIFSITTKALIDKYRNVPAEKFGTVDITIPGQSTYNVRDLHYSIGSGHLGIHIVPVSNYDYLKLPDGKVAPGYKLIDTYLRSKSNLKSEDYIYALVSYIRPEEHSVNLLELPYTQKMQMGHQHLAAYMGNGKTTHVLPRKTTWKGHKSSNMRWNADRYPANIQIISLYGVSQSTLNRNAHIVDIILSTGAKSPEDPQKMTCRTIDINTTLQFYRDWIRRAEYLQDLTWFTNCTVLKTIVVNVFLNVPHNKKSFQEIFGQDGSELWLDFQHRYEEISGVRFDPSHETHFTPLWKLSSLAPEEIRPLSLGEYYSFHAAKVEGWLDEFTGRQPLDPGKGLAWPLETVADLLNNFMNTYISFQDVGGIIASGMLLLLGYVVQDKLRISEMKYLEIISPVIARLFIVEGIMKDAVINASWISFASCELEMWLKKIEDQHQIGKEKSLSLMTEKCLDHVKRKAYELINEKDFRPAKTKSWIKESLNSETEKLRTIAIEISKDTNADFFSSPSIIHQISLGLHPKSPFVDVRTVCTVMDQTELSIQEIGDSSDKGNGLPYFLKTNSLFPMAQISAYEERKVGMNEKEISMKNDNLSLENETKIAEYPSPRTKDPQSVTPSMNGEAECECANGGIINFPQLVYALGKIGYDFVSQSRRDSIKQKMDDLANPENPNDLLVYLDEHPYEASAIQWTLNLEGTPIYAIEPRGSFARDAYELLRQFLREQIEEGVERVSIPGKVSELVRIRSGLSVPVIDPEIRGMYSWTTKALVETVCGSTPEDEAAQEEYSARQQGVANFLERVYYEIRNLGRSPEERALNFAATNSFEIEKIYEQAIQEEMELDAIEVERSPVFAATADCWDVKLIFFFPERQIQTVRKLFRFTIDVADIVPATVGPVRSWFIR